MNKRVFIATLFCILLASCGIGQPPICACSPPPPPAFMAVAQQGANEVAIYPLSSDMAQTPQSLISAAPTSTISAPGADSLMGGLALYVGENPNTIAIFNVVHNGVLGISITPAGTITNGVNDAAGFAESPFNGTPSLFVANRGGNDVAVYKGLNNVPTGFNDTPVMTMGVNAPNGLTFDGNGNLWVSQTADVVEFTPPFTTNSTPAATITNGLQSPSGIAFDWTGTMYVADKGKNAIVVYPAGGATQSLTFTNGIDGPGGLLISGSYLYVVNTTGSNVAEYRLPLSSSSKPFATSAVDMNRPSAIAVLE